MKGMRSVVTAMTVISALGWSALAQAEDAPATKGTKHKTPAAAPGAAKKHDTKADTPLADDAGEEPATTTRTTAAVYEPSPGAEPTKRVTNAPNRLLLGTGLIAFGGAYIPSAVVGVTSDRDADRRLLIPVVGPWADLMDRQCNERPCNNNFWTSAALVTSGLFQLGGAAAVFASFFVPESQTGRVFGPARAATPPSIQVAPVSFGSGGGLGAIGRF